MTPEDAAVAVQFTAFATTLLGLVGATLYGAYLSLVTAREWRRGRTRGPDGVGESGEPVRPGQLRAVRFLVLETAPVVEHVTAADAAARAVGRSDKEDSE